jgi:hypothetical protein
MNMTVHYYIYPIIIKQYIYTANTVSRIQYSIMYFIFYKHLCMMLSGKVKVINKVKKIKYMYLITLIYHHTVQ